jgi:thiamine-monophosphate kinase
MADAMQVPLSAAARAAVRVESGLLETALSGGDDYEIICTVPPARVAAFRRAARAAGVPVTDIGRIVRGQGAVFRGPDGKRLRFERSSFSHF